MHSSPNRGMRFTLLGSGAVRNNPERAGPSQLLMVGNTALMFDCGRSACTNLSRAGIAAETVDHLFLTHLHFDHIVDAAYFIFVGWNNSRKNVLNIYGPEGTRNFVERLVRPPFEEDIKSRLGHGKKEFGLDPVVTEVAPQSVVVKRDDFTVEAIAIPHGNITALAYRISAQGKRVVICGDGSPTQELVEFARGADLVAMECSGTKEFLATMPWGTWHATPEKIAGFASEAGVRQLILKHFVIEDITGDRTAAAAMAETIRRTYSGSVVAGKDGMIIDL